MNSNRTPSVSPSSGSPWSQSDYAPAGRLVPVLSASPGADAVGTALRLGRLAASQGDTVLILDGRKGELMRRAGVICARTLADANAGRCELRDCTYVTANEHFSIAALGALPLSDAIGTFAALSLFHDWVFAVPPEGLTQAAARLAAGSDTTVLAYETGSDRFMAAYWMIDAVRARNPRFDPHTVSFGDARDAVSTALQLEATVREHLGAAPRYAGHESDRDRMASLLEAMRKSCARRAA